MNGLTTHILDLAHGKPAAGVEIELYRFNIADHSLVTKTVTNADGRVDTPLLSKAEMTTGEYELLFHIGPYFTEQGVQQVEPPFLQKVAVRVHLLGEEDHYHVPLLVSPWGYQVYRGS
ncbi:hydroxyisourate hydrolase [Salsuginibacillus kocurii]|uniref:hydroxyisourate hydrolase n=1 Tax=Salsuginibacillus kocurii TaxID=427078 RepID=UPI00035FA4E3|nr:hydroxyisourate hydrolase [Salsuginibacillus kocurii]